ncbi:hypothetical protein C820_002613 [Clostridium sp. MD294]|nr:hypothetical protein C820_002613 [Clostridium sp. MD294]
MFAPKDCYNRLCVRVGGGESIFRLLRLCFGFRGFFRGCLFLFRGVGCGFVCACFFLLRRLCRGFCFFFLLCVLLRLFFFRRRFFCLCFLCLCLLLIFCLLRKVFIYVRNQPGGGVTDSFKGRFQLGKFPPAAPFCDIGKGIIGSVKPVVLAHGVGNAFRLYLTGAAVWSVCLFLCGGVKVYVMQLGVYNLMYQRFKVLQLAHALIYGYAFFSL